jgi:predicted enzyme related to lactoylglutathione lyase
VIDRRCRFNFSDGTSKQTSDIQEINVELLVNIDVDDMARAIAFYENALGLRLGRRLFGGSVVEMLGASLKINLLAKPSGSVPSSRVSLPRSYQRHWTPVHLDFVVENVTAAVERASAAGAILESDIQSFNWGRMAMMSDPFGHGLCLVEFIGKGYDEVA